MAGRLHGDHLPCHLHPRLPDQPNSDVVMEQAVGVAADDINNCRLLANTSGQGVVETQSRVPTFDDEFRTAASYLSKCVLYERIIDST